MYLRLRPVIRGTAKEGADKVIAAKSPQNKYAEPLAYLSRDYRERRQKVNMRDISNMSQSATYRLTGTRTRSMTLL